jgi:hypothetical protein
MISQAGLGADRSADCLSHIAGFAASKLRGDTPAEGDVESRKAGLLF